MPGYALLILPSSNRVYADQSAALTLAELALFSDGALDSPLGDVAPTTIGGVKYVTFDAAGPLSERDAAVQVVERQPHREGEADHRLDRFDDDLITIQKYQGKTNEQFTKLLINATLLSSAFGRDAFAAFAASPRLALLDPLCGRGTTLNQALRYGWDASGIEIDGKDFDAYSAFVQAYLKRKRLKHHVAAIPIRRDRRVVARRLTVTLAAEKADYNAGDTQQLDVVHADAIKAAEFFGRELDEFRVRGEIGGVEFSRDC